MGINNLVKKVGYLPAKVLSPKEEQKIGPKDTKKLKEELENDSKLLKILQDRGLIAKSDPICKKIEAALKDLDEILTVPNGDIKRSI